MKPKVSALVFLAFTALYLVAIYRAPAGSTWIVQIGWLAGVGMAAGLSMKWDGM